MKISIAKPVRSIASKGAVTPCWFLVIAFAIGLHPAFHRTSFAKIIEYSFSGTITSVDDGYESVATGEPFYGGFQYDTDAIGRPFSFGDDQWEYFFVYDFPSDFFGVSFNTVNFDFRPTFDRSPLNINVIDDDPRKHVDEISFIQEAINPFDVDPFGEQPGELVHQQIQIEFTGNQSILNDNQSLPDVFPFGDWQRQIVRFSLERLDDQNLATTLKKRIEGTVEKLQMRGDVNDDGILDLNDIDSMRAVDVVTNSPDNNLHMDLDLNRSVDVEDRRIWIEDLNHSCFGDSNLDGEFNSEDLVAIFQGNRFETDIAATWLQGDWSGDGRFSTRDLVLAFEGGCYEQGPMVSQTVPEPSLFKAASLLGMIAVFRSRKCRKNYRAAP